MIRPILMLLLFGTAAALSGCAHTNQTGSGLESSDAAAAKSKDAEAPTPARQMVTPKTDAGHPPLAASPEELMKENSQQRISQALVGKGFLPKNDPTPLQYLDALKAFQRSQGLAATGYADHETVMRLGVNPTDIDKSLGTPDVKAAKANGDLSK
jgi:Putative peptidoglycan binding domain